MRRPARNLMGASLPPIVVVGTLELSEGGDERAPLLVREPGLGVQERVLLERHLPVLDRLRGVVGLAVVAVPLGEVELLPTLPDVAGDDPRRGCDAVEPLEGRLVAVAVVAGCDGDS